MTAGETNNGFEIRGDRGVGVSTWKLAFVVLAVIAMSVVGGVAMEKRGAQLVSSAGVDLGFDLPAEEEEAEPATK